MRESEIQTLAQCACADSVPCVIGMGNPILTDDTVGLFVARRVGELCLARGIPVRVVEQYGWGLELLYELEGSRRALMIDSIMTGQQAPGECVLMGEDELARLAGGSFVNAHGFNLSYLLQAGRRTGCSLPQELIVLAVEVENVSDFSEQPTPEVSSCIERIAAKAVAIVDAWPTSEITGKDNEAGPKRRSNPVNQLTR